MLASLAKTDGRMYLRVVKFDVKQLDVICQWNHRTRNIDRSNIRERMRSEIVDEYRRELNQSCLDLGIESCNEFKLYNHV